MSTTLKTKAQVLLVLIALLFAGLVASTALASPAFASTPLDESKTGSITVSPTDGNSIGTELTLYKVAKVKLDNANESYVLTSEFATSGVDLTSLDDDDIKAKAKTLAAFATENNLEGDETKAVGASGSVSFDNLGLGLYLIIQKVARPGTSIVNPFLVSVPVMGEDGAWVYNVDAAPKAQTYELADVTVNKVWNDGGAVQSRPDSITVDLYLDSTLIDTVKLSSENNWSYTWENLQKSDKYSVQEQGADGYAATYTQNDFTLTITNTADTSTTPGGGGTTPTQTSGTPTPTLAQTGQLNWPVPVLAVAGVILFALGWALVFLKRKPQHA